MRRAMHWQGCVRASPRACSPARFQAKWIPVRGKKTRPNENGAFSSEVDTGSRQENAFK
jgi:hypothetical protein